MMLHLAIADLIVTFIFIPTEVSAIVNSEQNPRLAGLFLNA